MQINAFDWEHRVVFFGALGILWKRVDWQHGVGCCCTAERVSHLCVSAYILFFGAAFPHDIQ